MKRAVLAFSFSIFLVSACGGGQEPTSTASSKGGDKADDDEELSSEGKKWGGWRWKGRRNDCFFVVGNECFSKLAKACKRAKCGKDECGHDGSAPAKVECKK